MPKVTITLAGALRDQVGYRSVEITIGDVATFREAIALADEQHGGGLAGHLLDPDTDDVFPAIVAFISGESLRYRGGVSASLRDGDEIIIFRTDIIGG